jgi:two-component system, NtrC family, sensor histidine kinase KinB
METPAFFIAGSVANCFPHGPRWEEPCNLQRGGVSCVVRLASRATTIMMMRKAGLGAALGRAWWSLAGRIWLTIVVVVLLMAALCALVIARVPLLERSVNEVLARNYLSIEAARGMTDAIARLRNGDLQPEAAERQFRHWLDVEQHNITEPGEDRLAGEIGARGGRYFNSARQSIAGGRSPGRDDQLERELDQLVALNERAMFSANRRTAKVAQRLRTEEILIAMLAVLVLGGSGYLIARTLVLGPLHGLIATLRNIGDEPSLRSMPTPRTAELALLAREFNAMVERLQSDYRSRLGELELERSKTSAILESVDDGLIVLDQPGSIVHVNEIARAILDVGRDAIEGATLEGLAAQNRHVARLVAALEREPASDEQASEFRVFVRGRDHSYVMRTIPWVGGGNERLGTIVLLQDVTFIRDQERARTNLIATLSHELKTPLTSLAIGVDLLAEAPGNGGAARGAEIVATIRDDITRLKSIADSLMDASRKSVARIGVERRAIQLERIVREVCRPLALQAEEKGIAIELALDGGRPIPIWGDPIKLPWVISNLVGNALRYTPAGGTITVGLEREGKVARVRVTDTGSGIDPDVLPRIFEPYAQFPDGRTGMGSAGLGLYIAKEIVEAHAGRIFAASERGKGSTFTVEIPLREEAGG